MYLHMAYGTGLVLIRLIVKRRRSRSGEIASHRMALHTEGVDVVPGKQSRVRGPVRRVARNASLGLDGRMLVNKRPSSLGVALGADRVLIGSRLQVLGLKTSVGVVAIAAAHQSFIHLVVERLREGWLYIGVTAVA